MSNMQKKIALVTGGGSGIGRATALSLAARGATVVVADLNEANAAKVVAEIAAAGGPAASALQCDVAKDASVQALMAEVMSRYGRLDYAMNNAGITGPIVPLVDSDMGAIRDIIAIDLTSVICCMKEELKIMQAQKSGAIVNTCSIWGITAGANFVAYSAAKHGVAGATKAAALEMAQLGVRVNAICPGFTETPMVMDQGLKIQRGSAEHKAAGDAHPMGRMGQPEEMAEGAIWLLSDAASFVTGHCLMIDGGYVIR